MKTDTIPTRPPVDPRAGPQADLPADPRAYERRAFVRLLYGINRLYARVWHRLEVLNACPIPRDGPGILICNHSAGIDPVLLQSAIPRIVTWMLAREYSDLPGLNWMSARLGYIPVSRSVRDATSLKNALRALADHKLLGIFPEGRIETSTAFLPFQPGVSQIAAKTKTVIYPAYLAGLTRNLSVGRSLLEPQSARLMFGEPIAPLSDPAELHRLIESRMKFLQNQALAR